MSTGVPQPTGSNGQTVVTPSERQALIQKLASKWPLQLSTRIEEQAFEKSRGIKPNYLKFVQAYFQQIQTTATATATATTTSTATATTTAATTSTATATTTATAATAATTATANESQYKISKPTNESSSTTIYICY
ncbi:unnamed protein product [Rotaria sp. Silwood2]|nr:unnamed protein product [Rotaria sp. Silwood2]CAF3008736.1 unnamed protein product [Rotaria sp. Silwood2]CAF3951413.1 unnamed protein product [Rotaria sp. Silwood2]